MGIGIPIETKRTVHALCPACTVFLKKNKNNYSYSTSYGMIIKQLRFTYMEESMSNIRN